MSSNIQIPPRPARRTIGVLPGFQAYEGNTISYFLLSVFQGILASAEAHGCQVLFACGMTATSQPDQPCPAWPVSAPDTSFVPVGPWNTDGLIAIPPLRSESRSQYLQELLADNFPVVYAGTGEAGPSVMADNATGIYQAVTHLWQHGHRRIAYIAGFENVVGDSSIRYAAFQSTIQSYGLEPDPSLIAYGMHSAEGGWAAMQRLLQTAWPFSAVITSNYSSAVGAMRALRASGRRIPEDVAVIAFDDTLDAIAQTPPVTTVHQQTFEMGYRAVDLLMEYIAGARRSPIAIQVPEQLVIRRSCGCGLDTAPGAASQLALPSAGASATERVAREMVEVAHREAKHLHPAQLRAASGRLADAFHQSLAESDPSAFNMAVAELLQQIEAADEDPYILHLAISALRHSAAALAGAARAGRLAEDLVERAQLAISESSRRQSAKYLVEQGVVADRLGLMTAQLLASQDEAQIFSTLAADLPGIGIRHVEIALFESEADDPVAWSALWPGAQRRFLTRKFPPPDLYPAAESLRLALLPLALRDTQIGFIAFDAGRLELCATIARQVSAALLNCRLYREAAEGRRLAEAANQLKTRFLSTVSHELRTPLSVIVGLSELMLREQSEGKPPAEQDLQRIFISSQHLGQLIRDVLDLASSDAGQLRLTLEPLRLHEIFQVVAVTGEQLARDKGLAWFAHIPAEGPLVRGDLTRLRQVALNLISNAVKFTARGWVSFSVEVNAEGACVSVRDTGIGIAPREQPLIFDEFRQSERTAARGYGGVGLGLAITRRLVELHGGTVGVESSGVEGQGATFYFTLPLLAEQPAAEPAAQLPSQAVLLFTERAEVAERVGAYLQARGVPVAPVWIGQDADWQAPVLSAQPIAVLFDQQFALAQGWERIRSLKDAPATRDLPIVFFSLPAAGQAGEVLELDYQTKPISPEQLAQILRRSVDGEQAQHTILLADDDPAILDLHTRLIGAHMPSCRVLHARHGREALEILQRVRPDLVLLDLMMPELDGFGVLEAMRAREATRNVPVIVLTAQILTEADMLRLKRGVVAVLEKGVFSAEETLERVTAALTRTLGARSGIQRLVRRAMAYIHSHFAEPITREQLARHLAVSENYLTNCFQKELGISPLVYLNRYRIKQARELLETTDQSVTSVALEVGFSASAYFGRVFQREVGVSPRAYRRGRQKRPR